MIVYEENTKRIVVPSGLGNLTGLMEAEAQAMYNSGRTDGYNEGVEDGKSIQDRKLTDSVTFNENGEYDADYGYKKVIVDVDKQWDEGFEVGYESGNTDGYASGYTEGYASGYTDGYTSGYTDGYASATSRLVTFRFETYRLLGGGGPSAITVNGVPSEYFEHSEWYGANPSFVEISGHTGDNIILSAEFVVNLFGPAYESIWPEEWGAVYVNGNKTEPISQTKNVDGDYVIYNFTFNPCDCTSAITDAYESGYTDGYASGYTDGQASCPECSGSTDCSEAIEEAFESGYTNGYASGYTDGQASCPECSGSTCQLQQKNYSLTELGAGSWSVQPDAGYDGMSSLTIYDDAGYGQGLYDRGYAAGQAETKGGLYSIFVSFVQHPTLSSLPTDWKVNGFDFVVTSGYTNISTHTLIGVDGYLDTTVLFITPNIISFKVPTTDYEQWSEYVSASICKVNGVINYQTSAYDGGFLQHITGWAGTPDADDPSKTIITINIGQ